jgi:hypothetical protein
MTRRYEKLGSDAFATRLMLRRALCVRGEDAARMFYHPGRFTRRGALPPTAMALLQDFGSVATLDGEMHRQRKAMLMSLFGPLERQRLAPSPKKNGRHASRAGRRRAASTCTAKPKRCSAAPPANGPASRSTKRRRAPRA